MIGGINSVLLFFVFIAINSLFFAISYIMPGIKPRDVLPYQIFLFVLILFYKTLPQNKSNF